MRITCRPVETNMVAHMQILRSYLYCYTLWGVAFFKGPSTVAALPTAVNDHLQFIAFSLFLWLIYAVNYPCKMFSTCGFFAPVAQPDRAKGF